MSAEVQELIKELKEVRSLMIAMENLNQEERKIRQKFIRPQPIQGAPSQIKSPKKHWAGWWPICLVIAFLLLTLVTARSNINHWMERSQRDYENAVINDKWNWEANGGEPAEYPGYQGALKPYTREEAFRHALPFATIPSAVIVLVGGAVIFIITKIRNARIKMQNKERMESYETAVKGIQDAEANNRRVSAQIGDIHKRKQLVSGEYLTGIGSWFPEEYGFLEAVNYFIRELEIGTATTLPEAIKNYREYKYREKVTSALDRANDMAQIMIENQEVMIRKQDALIFQQMIGNAISYATYDEVKNIRMKTDRVAYFDAGTGQWYY